jgi:hypothetical protein
LKKTDFKQGLRGYLRGSGWPFLPLFLATGLFAGVRMYDFAVKFILRTHLNFAC